MYILAIAIHFYFLGDFQRCINDISPNSAKVSFFCSFLVTFVLLLNHKRFKLVDMHTTQCVLPEPTISIASSGLTSIFYCCQVKKNAKNVFLPKNCKNSKNFKQNFVFYSFQVAHILLEKKHIVRKNGYFDFLQEGIQGWVSAFCCCFPSAAYNDGIEILP